MIGYRPTCLVPAPGLRWALAMVVPVADQILFGKDNPLAAGTRRAGNHRRIHHSTPL